MTNDALNPPSSGPGQPTGTNSALNPSGTGQPTGTNSALNPSGSGLRIESNSTVNAQQNNITGVCTPGNVCISGGDFAETILTLMNQERASVGVPPLTWNNTLAADAQTYADYLVVTGKAEHPSAEWVAAHPTGPQGENLYYQMGGNLNSTGKAKAAFDWWLSEKVRYHGQPISDSTPANETVGHYTQMVWKSTTQLGCAVVSNGDTFKISCRFTPPGNFVGQTPY
jgi:uncharacterized protein YkwD